VDRTVETLHADVVQGDNVGAAEMLVDHLVSLGHRRIGYVNAQLSLSATRERVVGYQKGLERHGLPVDPRLVSEGPQRGEEGYLPTSRLLAMDPPPTAIMAMSKRVAIGSMVALRERGLRVPEDMALACFDDVSSASLFAPYLTCVGFPAYRFGVEAARMLLDRIGGSTVEPRKLVLPAQLLVRRSCGALPKDQDWAAYEMDLAREAIRRGPPHSVLAAQGDADSALDDAPSAATSRSETWIPRPEE
jgi:DNA-binding LacI/PurR family transcriptional regulator